MFTLTSLSFRSSAMRSSTGETAWHGPHHSAQKSTSTGSSLSSTSFSNVESVTLVAIASFRFFFACRSRVTRSPKVKNVALYTSLPDGQPSLPAAADGPRPYGARGGGARALGAGGDVRPRARAEPRRAQVPVHGRADHGQQPGRRPPRPRPDAEGR